jgi:hypothetical protein
MIKKHLTLIACIVGIFISVNCIAQQSQPVIIKANQPGAQIQPTMWGLFFEDINFAADGGIYAELVKNRSFEFFNPLMGWKELKNSKSFILIQNREASNPSNPRYAQITVREADGVYGTSNSGFRGMGVKKDMQYHFRFLPSRMKQPMLKFVLN